MRATKALLAAVCLASGVAGTALAGPYAVQVIGAEGSFGSAPYNDPNAVLGPPSTWFYDPLGAFSGGTTTRRVKLVEPPYNVAPNTNGLLTPNLIVTLGAGSYIIARLAQPIYDDPVHPYGIDFLVFGNSFYTPSTSVNDATDMNRCRLAGGVFYEPTKVSVSPGYTGLPGEKPDDPNSWPWYRYDNGPYGDTGFPTHAFKWNRATTNWTEDLMDFSKPVNPAMAPMLEAGGISVADAIDLYAGAGGGTGFDLRLSGFQWIQYVKVEGIDPDFSNGEIDAFSGVRPMLVGDTLSVTPENLLDGTATLYFQTPGFPTQNQLTLSFNALSDLAMVTTAPLTDFSAFASLPGLPLNAVQLTLSPILGTNPVTFNTGLALSTGQGYSGNGSDLLVVQSDGTNWFFQPFLFDPAHQQVVVPAVTNLSAFALVKLAPPVLAQAPGANGFGLGFTPVPGLSHTLERSTNLVTWTPLVAFTPTNAQPMRLEDNAAPANKAFYRLRVARP